jgi:hypothetical protein
MRDLTAKQKKLLLKWGIDFYKKNHEWLTIDNLPLEQYEELENINFTEVLHQNIERFLRDNRDKIQNSLTPEERILDY